LCLNIHRYSQTNSLTKVIKQVFNPEEINLRKFKIVKPLIVKQNSRTLNLEKQNVEDGDSSADEELNDIVQIKRERSSRIFAQFENKKITPNGIKKEVDWSKIEKNQVCNSFINEIINRAVELSERKIINLIRSKHYFSDKKLLNFERIIRADQDFCGKHISGDYPQVINF